jgi:hypothetical protein
MIDYFLLSSPVFSLVKLFDVLDFNPLFSDVHCGLCFNWYASVNNFTTHSLTIVVSRLRMPNGFTTKKSFWSIQWVMTSKSLTNYNHCCLTWTDKVKAIVVKLVSMKLLTKSATFLNVLTTECSLLKIEIHPVINLINLGSINRALKSVKKNSHCK